jgi:hypothetical protein
MYIPDFPVYFIKGNRRKAVYHSAIARELQATGWVQEGATSDIKDAPTAVSNNEPSEAAGDTADISEPESEPEPEAEPVIQEFEIDLDSMTKAQLIQFAETFAIEFKSTASKAELLDLCKQAVNG